MEQQATNLEIEAHLGLHVQESTSIIEVPNFELGIATFFDRRDFPNEKIEYSW